MAQELLRAIALPKRMSNDPSTSGVPDIPTPLLKAFLTPEPRVVLLVGAGLSRQVLRENGERFPSWPDLLRELFEWGENRGFSYNADERAAFFTLVDKAQSHTLIRAAGWLRMQLGDRLFHEFFVDNLRPAAGSRSAVHQAIAALPFKGIITFNYDSVIETTLRPPLKAIATYEEQHILTEIHKSNPSYLPFLIKAHGTAEDPASIIVGTDDYHRLIMGNRA